MFKGTTLLAMLHARYSQKQLYWGQRSVKCHIKMEEGYYSLIQQWVRGTYLIFMKRDGMSPLFLMHDTILIWMTGTSALYPKYYSPLEKKDGWIHPFYFFFYHAIVFVLCVVLSPHQNNNQIFYSVVLYVQIKYLLKY